MQEIRKEIQENNISISRQYITTPYYERMIRACRDKEDIVIFGAGSYGHILYYMLQKEKINTVRCFCDNNKEKWNTKVKGLNIYSLEEVKMHYPNAHFFITVKGYEMDIIRQLVNTGISINNIDIFAMKYTGLVV